jgi:hypothetical protein
MEKREISTGELAKLFDTTSKTIADLGKREIIVSAGKKGCWQRDASITGYVRHLRTEAAGRGGDAGASARERLGTAQALLTETKAKQLAGELVEKGYLPTVFASAWVPCWRTMVARNRRSPPCLATSTCGWLAPTPLARTASVWLGRRCLRGSARNNREHRTYPRRGKCYPRPPQRLASKGK